MEGLQYIDSVKFTIFRTGKVLELGQGGGSCMIWTGAHWGSTSYGKIALRLPSNPKKRLYFRLHRLIYSITNMPIPKYAVDITVDSLTPAHLDQEGRALDVSHICHKANCINPEHLVLEVHNTNMDRITCKLQNTCTKDHFPHCIFPGKFIYLYEIIIIWNNYDQ